MLAAAWALAMLASTPAPAVTLDGFKGQGMESIYGYYAPGNCALDPHMKIDENGFTFWANRQKIESRSFDHALTFMGPDYNGITKVFFPFPVNEEDPGPVVLLVNDGEKPGTIRVEANLGPGQHPSPFNAALTAAPLYKLCVPMIAPGANADE